MTELINNREYRINKLKEVIMDLHRGKSVKEVKQRFREVVKGLTHDEVASMEQALIQEGLPVEEIQRMCDVHASIFKEPLEKEPELEKRSSAGPSKTAILLPACILLKNY